MSAPSTRRFMVDVVFGGCPSDVEVVMGGAASWLVESLNPFGAHELTVTVTNVDSGARLAHLRQERTEPVGDLAVRHTVITVEPDGRLAVSCDYADDTTVTKVFNGVRYCPLCGLAVDHKGGAGGAPDTGNQKAS